MTTPFKWIKLVPHRTKYCVNGYIRTKDNTTFCNIPLLITYLILDYYYERESFRNAFRKEIIKLYQKNQIASILHAPNGNIHHTVYGSLLIDFNKTCIYEWNIRILKLPQNPYGSMITIGIANSYKLKNICYGYSNYGVIKDENENCLIYAEQFHINDMVTLQINTQHRTLRYFINDDGYTDCKISLTGTYYFAVSMRKSCSVQLIQFNQAYIKE